MALLMKILYALAVAVAVYIICVFFGGLLVLIAIPVVAYVGNFIKEWATAFAVLAFIFAFVSGGGFPNLLPPSKP